MAIETVSDTITSATVEWRSPSNIALVKYWGKRNEALNLPAASSIGLTLSGLEIHTTVSFENSLSFDCIQINSRELPLDGTEDRQHIEPFLNIVRKLVDGGGKVRRGFLGIDLTNLEALVRMKSESEIESSDQHIVNAVEFMLQHAYDTRASDIHIEPKRETSLIRFRIDGVLHDIQRMPKVLLAMSGGVDSSVAAALLQREGYDVVGCFMRLGSPGDSLDRLEPYERRLIFCSAQVPLDGDQVIQPNHLQS